MSKIGVCGITGKMGRAICRIVLERGHQVVAGFDAPTSPFSGKDLAELIPEHPGGVRVMPINKEAMVGLDCVVDFSAPAATMQVVTHAVEQKVPIVIGTTGIGTADEGKIRAAAEKIPVLYASNTSVGVNILFKLTELAAKAIPDGYDVEVFEAHHRFKKDAPSGTAKTLINIIKKFLPRLANAKEEYAREGITGAREDNEIGVQVMRGGDIVGEHTVYIVGMGERIELTHRATNRDVLAEGAVRAMEFLCGKKAKLYTMNDVLGL